MLLLLLLFDTFLAVLLVGWDQDTDKRFTIPGSFWRSCCCCCCCCELVESLGSCSSCQSRLSLAIETSTGKLLRSVSLAAISRCCCCLTRLARKSDSLAGLKRRRERSLPLLLSKLLSVRNLSRLLIRRSSASSRSAAESLVAQLLWKKESNYQIRYQLLFIYKQSNWDYKLK